MRPIDADALMKKVCGNCQLKDCVPDVTDTVYGCIFAESIDQMPTIEAEPVRHAEWDCIDDDGGVYRCSACGETWYLEAGTPKENNMNYCPTCDAKMDGGERRCQK